MKANELRIGNLVLLPCEGHEDELVSINKYDFEEPYNFKPIPLTEEILLKAGFDYKDSGVNLYIWYNNYSYYPFEVYEIDNKYYPFDVSDNGKEVKYVHQLQNLYFVLTGEELEIKL